MALSKKPIKKSTANNETISEEVVEALINKGGSVPASQPQDTPSVKGQKKVLKGGQVPVQLRISPEILDVIDQLIEDRLIPVSRHSWFMNAIAEQIKREQEK